MNFHKFNLMFCVVLSGCLGSGDSYRITEKEKNFSDSARIVSESFLGYIDAEQIDSAVGLLSDYYINRHKNTSMSDMLKKMRKERGKSSNTTLVGFEMRKMAGEQNSVYYEYEVLRDSTQPKINYHFWFFTENKSSVKIDSIGVEVFDISKD